MINAKQEFIKAVGTKQIKCASIAYCLESATAESRHTLHVGYTQSEYDAFLVSLDFVYDNGFGAQHLFGTVWLVDGTWLERYEYDGEEQWVHDSMPEIPKELQCSPPR